MANGHAPRPPKPRKATKVFKQAAPNVVPGKGLGTGLGELLARAGGTKPPSHTGRPKPVAIQRPPTSRVRRAQSAEDLFTQTIPMPAPAPAAVRPLQREVGQGASSAQELLDLTEGMAGSPSPVPTADEIRLLSPTRSSNPTRPRTLEISYNIDQAVLRVVFRDGGTYDYFGVPRAVYSRLARVKSPGKFIDANIKGAYAYEKVAF